MDMKKLDKGLSVAGQIRPEEVPGLAEAGFCTIICNRPDGEDPGQPDAAEIEIVARAAGLAFADLPVTSATLTPEAARNFAGLLATLPGPVLAYCRSGARSERLWQLAAETAPLSPARRTVLIGAATLTAVAGLAAVAGRPVQASVATKARIVIAGGGAAGLTTAALLTQQLDGAVITVVEPREEHNYQPGYTLVGAGVKPADYTVLRTADYVSAGVTWLRETVAAFEPEANAVVTDAGTRLDYDYLIVATGLVLDYAGIEGMSPDLIGQHGIGSVYAGPEAAAASWQALSAYADTGGVGIFTRPATDMKCAGAPLKQAFLADDHLRRRGTRDRSEVIYTAHSKLLFSVPLVADRVEELFVRQGIEVRREHVLAAIDPATRIARFATPEGGSAEMKWDFINVIPPMRAPMSVRASALPWQEGRMAADGWIEVDKFTLRHARFANVFGVGDICGVPKGKTAASVKWQAPVAVHHIVEEIAGRAPVQSYNGYTSCPLITRIGTAMLVEFDYDDNLVPTFPGIDPLAEGWLPWVIKPGGPEGRLYRHVAGQGLRGRKHDAGYHDRRLLGHGGRDAGGGVLAPGAGDRGAGGAGLRRAGARAETGGAAVMAAGAGDRRSGRDLGDAGGAGHHPVLAGPGRHLYRLAVSGRAGAGRGAGRRPGAGRAAQPAAGDRGLSAA